MILRTLLLLAFAGTAVLAKEAKPNVLFIVIDDMNDSISLLDPKSPIKTPNIERLAKRGMSFSRAYCISAACNPSRVAATWSPSVCRRRRRFERFSTAAAISRSLRVAPRAP